MHSVQEKFKYAVYALKEEPLNGTKILFCGCAVKFFLPWRGTNSKNNILTDTFVIFNGVKDDCFKYFLLVKLIIKYVS